MPTFDTTEKRFEADIESFFISPEGGYTKTTDRYDPKLGVFPARLSTLSSALSLRSGRDSRI